MEENKKDDTHLSSKDHPSKEIKSNALLDQRRILTDKSNSKTTTYKLHQADKALQKPIISSVYKEDTHHSIDNNSTQSLEEKQQEKEQEIAPKDEVEFDHVADFYEDNKTRYAADVDEDDFFDVVPIIPIVVPQRIRHLFVKDVTHKRDTNGTYRTTRMNKRQLPEDEEDNENADQTDLASYHKKQKTQLSVRHLTTNKIGPLALDVDETSLKYEKEQEIKSKLVMLQTNQPLKERQLKDPMMVHEYADEIFANLYASEPNTMADPNYACSQQHEVTWKMRSVLIDWVIEIHYLFQLLPETLFLAVNIIDRFLSLRTVVLGKLQLVGITALFIATKFEEITAPTIQDFLYMTDKAVEEDELIKAECFILKVIDFRICYPNPLNFLRRVCTEENDCDVHTRMLAKYFMEISCVDHRFIDTRPSAIAAASFWLAQKMLARGNWTDHLTELSGYSTAELKPTVESMLDYLSQPVSHEAFFRKWSSKRLSKAGIFVRDWINKYYVS